MAKPSLDSCVLKWQRADQHLALLKREVPACLASERRSIIGEFNRDASEYVFRVTGEAPPTQWGVLVGDWAHNLRCALNYLLREIIRLRTGKPKWVNEFPIYSDKTLFNSGEKGGGAPRWEGVSPDDLAIIEAVQPYQFGKESARHPLALLSRLNNADKHRLMHIGFIAITIRWWEDGSPRPVLPHDLPVLMRSQEGVVPADGFVTPIALNQDAEEWKDFTYASRSDDRTVIMSVGLLNPGPDPMMKVEPTPAFDVSLGDIKTPVILSNLIEITREVEELINRFRPQFET